MNIMGNPTYLTNDDDSFIVSEAEIKGDHGLPMYTHAVVDQLHLVINSSKFQ